MDGNTQLPELAKNLKAARESVGMSVIQAAEAIGVKRQSIYDWEKGTRPDDESLRKAAIAYRTTVPWLHYGVEGFDSVKEAYEAGVQEGLRRAAAMMAEMAQAKPLTAVKPRTTKPLGGSGAADEEAG